MFANDIKFSFQEFDTRFNTIQDCVGNVFYLRTKTKVTPINKQDEYSSEVRAIRKLFEEFVTKKVMETAKLEDDYIFEFKLSDSKSVRYGKISFLSYDFVLKTKSKFSIENSTEFFENFSKKLNEKLKNILERDFKLIHNKNYKSYGK